MIFAGFFGLVAFWLAGGEFERPSPGPKASAVRTMTVEHQMVLRVPIRPQPRMMFRWEEDKGPRCLPAAMIAGAMLSSPDSIDILLRNRQRMRARLDNDCDGLDYYDGLYLETDDGKFCAKRDSIRSRMGGACRIEKFRTLVPKPNR